MSGSSDRNIQNGYCIVVYRNSMHHLFPVVPRDGKAYVCGFFGNVFHSFALCIARFDTHFVDREKNTVFAIVRRFGLCNP